MTITQTVEIPASHRLTIDVPREIPAGPAILVFRPARFCGGGVRTTAEDLQTAEEKAADPNRKPISRYFGRLSPNTFGDGVAYQRSIRDEWDG